MWSDEFQQTSGNPLHLQQKEQMKFDEQCFGAAKSVFDSGPQIFVSQSRDRMERYRYLRVEVSEYCE